MSCFFQAGGLGFRRTAPGLVLLLLALVWSQAAEPDIRRDATVEAIEKVMPSVVNIATETVIEHHDFYENLFREFYGWPRFRPRQEKSISLGSGVIIDEAGYLLTNFHVVSRASRVQVKLWNGHEYEADPIIATSGSDVALLKIRAKPGEKFTAIKFARDDDLLLGETVLALGNPFGLGGSVTKGILSSKTRRPPTGNEPLNVEDWLETDAAINPGNSGGPLVNLRGELIGLNVAVAREEQGMGMGFSIPIKRVSEALSAFFMPEWTDGLWFGARFQAGPGPLQITTVQPESPAATGGLHEGDQVLQINGQAATDFIAANRLLCEDTNRADRLLVRRGEERKTLSVRLVPLADLIELKVGLSLSKCAERTAAQVGLGAADCLAIEAVEKDGPAAKAGLQRGYILSSIEGESPGELKRVAEVLAEKKKGEAVRLTVIVPRRLDSRFVEYTQGTVDVEVR
jgi:S1-C subfamily serine protease